jgi:hypothetical protein
MSIQAPNIPRPKHEDEDYMKVWHQLLDKELEYYHISRECNTWRRNFYIVVFFWWFSLFLLMIMS